MSAQSVPSHDLNIPLPAFPLTNDPVLKAQLDVVYQTINIMALEITSLRKRVKALENYNTAHP